MTTQPTTASERAAALRADANELDTYAEAAEAFAAREDRAANAFGYGSERAANARRDARRAREEAAAARERADALDPNDPDQGNCPDGHPCRLTPDATARECLTCGYTGHPLTASSADEPENLDPAECCGAEPGAPCRSWCLNSDNDRDPEPADIIALAIAGDDDASQADFDRARAIVDDLRAAGFTVEPIR